MDIQQLSLILSIVSIILLPVCILLVCVCIIKVYALEKSTHSVQYIPVDEEIDKANQEYMQKWATSEEAINKEQKLYREELKDEMPEFSLDDEDKEIFSI
jgi:hypothetical protein